MGALTLLSEKYERNPLARIIINAVPYIGGSLDVALTSKWNEYQQKRIDDFLDKLSTELEQIQEDKLDKEFINSEDFFDIVYSIVKDVTTSRLSEKRVIYAKLLKDSLEQGQDIYDLESLIKQVEDIKEKDMLFLKHIQEYTKAQYEDITGEKMSKHIADSKNFDTEEVTRLLFRFAYLGLLNYAMNTLTLREEIKFTTTHLFSKLCGYISEQ